MAEIARFNGIWLYEPDMNLPLGSGEWRQFVKGHGTARDITKHVLTKHVLGTVIRRDTLHYIRVIFFLSL